METNIYFANKINETKVICKWSKIQYEMSLHSKQSLKNNYYFWNDVQDNWQRWSEYTVLWKKSRKKQRKTNTWILSW